jgi:anti-anti-sigma factor
MPLNIHVEEARGLARTVALGGRLDNDTASELDQALDPVLSSPIKVLVFDLAKLEYISSAGLRSIFKAQRSMKQRAGEVAMLHVQPQVKKVFEIVKTIDLKTVFVDVKELDDYLDSIQRGSSGDD